MEDKKLKKIGVAAVSASVVTAGTIAFAAAYQSGIAFDPSGKNRDLQTNQVVFSDDDDSVSHKKNENKKESELLQKNQEQDTQSHSKLQNQADYLFDNDVKLAENTNNSAMINDGNDNRSSGNLLDDVAQTPGSKKGTILDITGDKNNADVIISGNGNNGSGAGGNGGSDVSNKGDSKGDNKDNNRDDNKGDNTNPGNKYTQVTDPTSKKPPADKTFTNRPYEEGSLDNKETVIIQFTQPANAEDSLYMGQLIDATRVYNALDTYALGIKDGELIRYNWDEDAMDNYVRIDGVSFDGGETWVSKFPLTIPEEVDQDTMLIKASYRLTKGGEWQNYVDPASGEDTISYTLKPACVFVMSEKLPEGSEQIDESKVLSNGGFLGGKYPESETQELFKFTDDLLKKRGLCDVDESNNVIAIHALVPGWTENDELVPWIYPVTKGRHILEPADVVPLSDDYKATMKLYWMTDDYKVDFSASNLYSLQTMTDYEKKSLLGDTKKEYLEVHVPEYIQSVDIDDSAELTTDYLSLPDSVLYYNESSQGITVNRGYIVGENNPNYASTEEGVLTNKGGTEYQVIPAKIKELTVGKNVTKVNLTGSNQVSVLRLESDSLDQMPEIVMTQTDIWGNVSIKGQNCEVILKDALLDDFITANFDQFTNHNSAAGYANFKSIASEENPDVVYTVDSNGQVIGSNGALRKVIETGRSSMKINDDVKTIKENAFSDIYFMNRLMMPNDGKIVKMEKDCFQGSSLQTIACYSQEQYDYVMAHLEESGAPEGIRVEFTKLQTSKEGFIYYEDTEDGITSYVLAEAPKNLTSFAGEVTAQDGTSVPITEISDNAFSQCKELKWVELPESVTSIGYEAFYGCSSLQGVLIQAKDYIYIGNKSFDHCDNLRFVASNAMMAQMQDGYDPVISQMYGWTQMTYFYAPTGSAGYGDHALAFTAESGVTAYAMVDISDDCKMLYGMNDYGQPWLGIRSGTDVGNQVTLPSSTLELYSYSMADIQSSSGKYELNWDDLWTLEYYDEGVFYDSDLGGDIALSQENSWIDDLVFSGCSEITNFQVKGQLIRLGKLVFEGCEKLESVTFGGAESNVSLAADLFHGCKALRTLTLGDSSTEYKLSMEGNVPFQFNSEWTQEEEWNTLHINIPYDPEHFYIKKWRFYLAGYREEYNSQIGSDYPPYLNMWEGLYQDYLWNNMTYPTYEEIDEELEEKLIFAENGLRKMLGEEPVDEPTNFYPYRKDGMTLTLIGAPSNITYAFLYGEMMEFPEGWSLDYIASGAFSKSKHLESLSFVDNLTGIYPDIFKGVESDEITLRFWAESVPELIVEKEGVPYSFGVDNSKIKLEVNSWMAEEFINKWSYPLAGYSTREAMEDAVKTEMTQTNGAGPTEEELKAEVDKRILPYMNIVRGWLGLDPVESIEEAGSGTEELSESGDTLSEEIDGIKIPAQGSGDEKSADESQNDGSINENDTDTDGSDASAGTDDADHETENGDKDKNQADGDISGDNQTEDKNTSENTEQSDNVKKDDSNSGSQDQGMKEETKE